MTIIVSHHRHRHGHGHGHGQPSSSARQIIVIIIIVITAVTVSRHSHYHRNSQQPPSPSPSSASPTHLRQRSSRPWASSSHVLSSCSFRHHHHLSSWTRLGWRLAGDIPLGGGRATGGHRSRQRPEEGGQRHHDGRTRHQDRTGCFR